MITNLVLEGGAMRGIYTCGVLDYFMDNGIEFPKIFGVSAGSGHSMSYVSGQRGRAYRVGVGYLNDYRYCSFRSLILTGNFFGADFIYRKIPAELDFFDYKAFDESNMKLIAVCTNIKTGLAEYIPIEKSREDIIYVRASSSLPLLSRIVKTPKGDFLDGGICDSIPVRHALECSDKVVCVLTQPEGFVKSPSTNVGAVNFVYRKYPEFIEAYKNRHINYNESIAAAELAAKEGKVFIIRPSKPLGFERVEKDRTTLEKTYELGYNDAKESGIEKFLSNQ